MVSFNFTVFIDKVESGEKTQTIRRKRRCKPGDRLQLYTGMRHKGCRKLRDAVCTDVTMIDIGNDEICFYSESGVDGFLEGKQADKFARLDGFDDLEHMVGWFREAYPDEEFPLTMYLHEWEPLPKTEAEPAKDHHPRPRRYAKKRKL